MKGLKNKIMALVVLIAALLLAGCQKKASHYEHIEPAHLEHIENSELAKLHLTEKAVERTGILTDAVREEWATHSPGKMQLSVPYAALIYDAQARVWVYTNPEPLTYLRHEVKVDFIKDGKATLLEGPPAGTAVVVQGAAELYGTEYEVGH